MIDRVMCDGRDLEQRKKRDDVAARPVTGDVKHKMSPLVLVEPIKPDRPSQIAPRQLINMYWPIRLEQPSPTIGAPAVRTGCRIKQRNRLKSPRGRRQPFPLEIGRSAYNQGERGSSTQTANVSCMPPPKMFV